MSNQLETESTDDDLCGWDQYASRAGILGHRLVAGDFPPAREDRADGLAHLAQQLTCWTNWYVGHADSRRPAFQRQNDLVTPWGGPNADNVYRHARVTPGRRYRIRGRMNTCEEFMLAVRAGFMHEEVWGTLFEISATDLGLGEGDEFEFFVGGPDDPVPLPDRAAMVSIREYYFDWRPQEPATFTIECVDADVDAPADRLDPETVQARLRTAITATEHSIENWNRYLLERKSDGPANQFRPPHKVSKGLAAARYGFCIWDLGPDEALLVESDVPDARYWSLQLYEMAWYELVDPSERITSLNHRQVHVDDDGRFRVVLAHNDPGVANWLDTAGRQEGLLTFRWFWQRGVDPSPAARVIRIDDAQALAAKAGTSVTQTERLDTMRARREHLAWRFRT